jgi:hypothetical protein
MPDTRHRDVQPTAGLWSRLLDGVRPWGSFDVKISRYGVRRYRLIVYPPGSTIVDRRLARLYRGWPLGGAMLGFFTILLLVDAVSSADGVLAVAAATYLGVWALLFVLAGPARVPVKSMSVLLMPGTTDVTERRRYTNWKTLAQDLTRADHLLTTGAISPVEHEAVWWHAYDHLEETA